MTHEEMNRSTDSQHLSSKCRSQAYSPGGILPEKAFKRNGMLCGESFVITICSITTLWMPEVCTADIESFTDIVSAELKSM